MKYFIFIMFFSFLACNGKKEKLKFNDYLINKVDKTEKENIEIKRLMLLTGKKDDDVINKNIKLAEERLTKLISMKVKDNEKKFKESVEIYLKDVISFYENLKKIEKDSLLIYSTKINNDLDNIKLEQKHYAEDNNLEIIDY